MHSLKGEIRFWQSRLVTIVCSRYIRSIRRIRYIIGPNVYVYMYVVITLVDASVKVCRHSQLVRVYMRQGETKEGMRSACGSTSNE